jgi:hypothetical protein
VSEQPEGPTFIDGAAVLSIVCAAIGGLTFFGAVWFGFLEDAPETIAWDRLVSVAPGGGEIAFVALLAAVLALGIAGSVLGLLARRRIRASKRALRGRRLALLGIGAGIALIVLFALAAAAVVSTPPPVPAVVAWRGLLPLWGTR